MRKIDLKDEEKDYLNMLFEISKDNSKFELYNEKIDAFNAKYIKLFFERIDAKNKDIIVNNSNYRADNMVFLLNCDKEKAHKYCLIQEINNYLTPKIGEKEEKTTFNYILEFVGLDNLFANGLFFNIISFDILFICREKTPDFDSSDELYFCHKIISLFSFFDVGIDDFDQIIGLIGLFEDEIFMTDKDIERMEKAQEDEKLIQLYNDMKPFIKGATPDIYRSIIKNHKLPEYTDPITMISGNKPEIIRFGDCFGIKPAKLSAIFGVEVSPSDRNKTSKNDLFRALKKYTSILFNESSN
ncbi:MAG: hypothetical protein ACK5MH_05800 [Bacteroidales bacterium]